MGFSWPEARNRNGEPEAGKKREIIGNAAAFRANGDVLATFWDSAGKQVHILDRANGLWLPVAAEGEIASRVMFGADGNSVVMSKGQGDQSLIWVDLGI